LKVFGGKKLLHEDGANNFDDLIPLPFRFSGLRTPWI
jgi:hypothetical protein